jgi:hypothetical protein
LISFGVKEGIAVWSMALWIALMAIAKGGAAVALVVAVSKHVLLVSAPALEKNK